MASELRVTVHFLQPYSHGRGEDGLPEWPPSPLRLFQALVASSVGRQGDPERRARTVEALRWLERQASPEIVAPPAMCTRSPYRLFVPDNVGDKAAKAWSMGRDANLADYRTEKDVRWVRLEGGTAAVHYIFRNVDGVDAHLATLRAAARSITHLGWGIDMVAGDAGEATGGIDGERWIPGRHGGRTLRRPIAGTFDALERKHAQFLQRLDGGTFRPVPPLSTFAMELYARATDPAPRPFIAFRVLKPITGDRVSLDPRRRTRDVAAWLRHAAAEVCEGWPFGPVEALVHGHGQGAEARDGGRARLSFLPLPTITPQSQTEGIARVMIAAPPGLDEQLAWMRAHLAGHELMWDGKVVAFLDPLPRKDWVLQRYIMASDHWSTVTPVVLPGHDDRSPRKAERLVRKAFLQAGFEPEVIDAIKELEWRKVGFRAGVDVASRYLPPDKVSGPMFHVRVRFAEPLAGPVAIGSGRYRGMGVFAVQ
ncbi:type I-G CRISPR-associated protein Csb2 [Sorangium sp. So ce1024]|uniref:type I-G CRISPR-associated protein Csb2 n=1 Tax=Sorangium sp. So ce1024 TaxID=3133327 RepID=UPI003F0280CA